MTEPTASDSLRVLVLPSEGRPFETHTADTIGRTLQGILGPQDTYVLGDPQTPLSGGEWDAALVWAPCGSIPLAAPLAEAGLPCFAFNPILVFHPFFAAFYREVEARGGTPLPADDRSEIAASLRALRARKGLAGTKLLVMDAHENDRRTAEVETFARGCRARLGVEVIHRPAAELQARAGAYRDAEADGVLAGWGESLLHGPGEMDAAHMRQVARLYLAERALLDETGAAGITVDDIGAFLIPEPRQIMPNVTYGALVHDGYLACEEGDIEVLTSELLLRAGLGAHPTMSNIYLAYRDAFDALSSHEHYTAEEEAADYRQCVADNHLVAAHFSASGVLPPGMTEEGRYRVREALPAWPGQSMIAATPRLGPVTLARLTPEADGIHLVPGVVDGRRMDDRFGWYRGRWFIQVPSVPDFIARCLHQHYAIGPEGGESLTLNTLTDRLLRLRRIG